MWQALNTQRSAKSNLFTKNFRCKTIEPRYLAGATSQNNLLGRKVLKPCCIKARARLFQNLFDAGPHDTNQLSPTDSPTIVLPIASVSTNLNHLAVVHAGRHHTAIECLDPLRSRQRHLQTHRNVTGDVITPHTHCVSINHVLAHEDRNTRGATTHINTSSPQFLFILNKRRHAGHIGRRCQASEFKITALDTEKDVLHSHGINSQHMHIGRQHIPNKTARISHPGSMIERKIHWLCVQNLTVFTVVRDITRGHDLRDALLCDHTAFKI